MRQGGSELLMPDCLIEPKSHIFGTVSSFEKKLLASLAIFVNAEQMIFDIMWSMFCMSDLSDFPLTLELLFGSELLMTE